jgi:hypothetical protein
MARLRRSACLVLSCWLLILAPTAAGQDSTGLTLDLVQSRLDALKAAGEAESTLALRNDYNKVLQLLQQATDSLAAADNYSAALASAPKQEHEIRSRLQDAKEPDSVKLQAGYKALGLEQSEAEAALLKSQLTAATDERDTLGKRLSSQESNETRRRQRVLEIQSLSRDLPTEPVTVQVAASPSAKEAADWLMEAQRRALAAELRALEAASDSQPVRNALSRAQRAERLQLIRELDAKLEVLGTKIRLDREKQTDSVRHELERLQTDRPMLGFLAGTNLQLSERLRELGQQVTVLDDCHKQMEQATAQLEERYAAARRRVEFARESTELGQILLAQSRETEAVLSQRRDCSAEIQISDLIIDRINFEERLQGMDSGARYLDQLVDQFPGVDGLSPTERQRALALADSQRKLLGDMVALQSQYIEASADIRASK